MNDYRPDMTYLEAIKDGRPVKIKDAAYYGSVSIGTIWRLIRLGKLKKVGIHNSAARIPVSELPKLVEGE
jgi:hypothetical protein